MILNNLSDNRTLKGTSKVTLSPIFAREYSLYKFFMFDSEESRHWFLFPCIYVYMTVFIAILQSIGAVAAPYLAKQNLPANALESNWATNGNADKVCSIFRKLFAMF